jgi:hypothetical protein
MDWGLMSLDGENKFLRDEIVYPSTVSEARALLKSYAKRRKENAEICKKHHKSS